MANDPPAAWPDHVRLVPRAQRDLDILDRKPEQKRRVLADIHRLAMGQLPLTAVKKLKGFQPPLWQLDSGEFRVFYTWEQGTLWIRGVLRKPEQSRRLRSLR